MADSYNNRIRIFPSSNRDVSTDRYGDNFVTEYNLSSLINKLIDASSSGFVISTTTGTNYTAAAEFNIAGYFIHVDQWNTIIDSTEREKLNKSQTFVNFTDVTDGNNTYIAARIDIDKPEVAPGKAPQEAYWKLGGQDNIGSTIVSFPDDSQNLITLKLLLNVGTKENPNWIINPDAKLKFSNISIDDGRVS